MKNFILLILLFIFSITFSFAQSKQSIGVDNLKIGTAASAFDSTIELIGTNVKIKGNKSTGKAQFTNDGSVWKNLGSGSGSGSGGINVLANNSFEDGIGSGWTSSGGTFSVGNYTNAVENELNYAQFIASTSGQYFESSLTVTPDMISSGCLGMFDKYATADTASWKTVILDSSANVLFTQNLVSSGGASVFAPSPGMPFVCLASGATVKIRVESLAAGTIKVDLAYLGGNRNLVNVSQASIAGESYFAGSASCLWSRTSTTVGAFTADADCPGPTIVNSSIGVWATTDANLPKQSITALPAGKYKAYFRTAAYMTVANNAVLSITDGTTTCEPSATNIATTQQGTEFSCVFVYTSAGDRYFELVGASEASTLNIYSSQAGPPRSSTRFILEYFPSDTQAGVTSDQSGWFIDANIGGTNPSLGLTDQASYVDIGSAALDMTMKTGSAPAEIGCSTTNPPTGLTCAAGNESVSVAWTPPYTGWFDVCFDFSQQVQNGASGATITIFQVVETATNAVTILTEGGERKQNYFGIASSTMGMSKEVCGSFYAANVSKKMHRLFYEQDVAGTITTNTFLTDRDSGAGQRDVRVTVRPSTMNVARPVLTGDQVTTPGAVKPVTYSAFLSSTGVVSNEIGDFITSNCANTGGAGRKVCALNSGATSVALNCGTTAGAGFSHHVVVQATSTSSIEFENVNTSGVSTAGSAHIFCHGLQ